MKIERAFFQRDPLVCARELIGCRLQWGCFSATVVETEAYDAEGDQACHTFFRPSARAFVEAHPAGTAYVYFNYGVHWMLNVLVKGKREGFVLFRALEPLAGVEAMKQARRKTDLLHLCSGPGKLTQALGINGSHHGLDLCADPAYGLHSPPENLVVEASLRIGITRAIDFPWRFSAAGNLHVSGARRSRQARLR